MNALIYSRVSTEEQAREGVSLDAQEERCRAYAKTYDLSVVGVVRDDGYSAATLNRPGIDTMFERIALGGIHGVIIVKLDRITRSVKDLWDLLDQFENANVALHGVQDHLDTSSASGRLVVNIMASTSQWEREVIGERTKDALHHIRAQGYHVGRAPYGWATITRDGPGALLTPISGCEPMIKLARTLRESGVSIREIASIIKQPKSNVQRILDAPLQRELVAEGGGFKWPTIETSDAAGVGLFTHST